MPDRLSDAERRIYGFVSSEAQDLYRRGVEDGPGWSNGLTRALHRAGEDLGYDIADMRRNLVEFRQRVHPHAVAVVCKVRNNWRDKLICADLAKLGETKADLRVFVFDLPLREQDRRFDYLLRKTRARRGQRFLAIGTPRSAPDFIPYRAWTT
jgi:hypothetical protein